LTCNRQSRNGFSFQFSWASFQQRSGRPVDEETAVAVFLQIDAGTMGVIVLRRGLQGWALRSSGTVQTALAAHDPGDAHRNGAARHTVQRFEPAFTDLLPPTGVSRSTMMNGSLQSKSPADR
jgi:hypothetical protein